MGLLSNLISKIFGHAETVATSTQPAASATGVSSPSTSASIPNDATTAAVAPPPKPVDVAAILQELAAKNPEKLDWKKSIVDLMKLVGMDSSFSARKELAKELHYTGDPNDSASMNIWLHQQVMKKLAENGGKVPAELLH